jgi:hypothetical protein
MNGVLFGMKKGNSMYISEVNLTFQTLEQAMNLPPTAKVVAITEIGEKMGGLVKLRIVSSTEPPEEYALPQLSMLGEAYRHPEKYKARRAINDSGSSGEAAVDVIKAR